MSELRKRGRPRKTEVGIKGDLIPINQPRCKVCQSPIRDKIDRLAASGYGSTAIAEEIIGEDPNLSINLQSLRKNIERHVKQHLRIKERKIRKILENRAMQNGILLENIETAFVDERSLLDILVSQATEQSADPNFRVHMKDALEAIKIKKEIESSEFSEQIKVMEKQVWAITQAVKDIVPLEYFTQITMRARELFEGEIIELPYVKETKELETNERLD